jgi:hypothetical protein
MSADISVKQRVRRRLAGCVSSSPLCWYRSGVRRQERKLHQPVRRVIVRMARTPARAPLPPATWLRTGDGRTPSPIANRSTPLTPVPALDPPRTDGSRCRVLPRSTRNTRRGIGADCSTDAPCMLGSLEAMARQPCESPRGPSARRCRPRRHRTPTTKRSIELCNHPSRGERTRSRRAQSGTSCLRGRLRRTCQ